MKVWMKPVQLEVFELILGACDYRRVPNAVGEVLKARSTSA
jgi:hypothetical protein